MPCRPIVLATLGLLAPLAVACGAAEPESTPQALAASTDHGDFSGAVELDEPAAALTTVDAGGVVRHLDLLDESVTELADLGALGDVSGVHTDGRYLFVATDEGVEVVDSGVWTWDHVDHFHYYRADPQDLGLVEGGGRATTATTNSSTSGGTGIYFPDSGEAVLLDTEALADGTISELFHVEGRPHEGMLVPVGDYALMTEPGPGRAAERVVALDSDGERLPAPAYVCQDAAGTITTRVATVIGCADGALLASTVGDELLVERIAYPRGTTAPPAIDFAGRDGRPTVAALAGPNRVWLLDTREKSWSLIDSPVPLTQVASVDDEDERLLGLSTDGRVVVLDGGSGKLLSSTSRLAGDSLRSEVGEPTLVVDQQRAYLAAPAERRLIEIDFADDARIARTFDAPTEPLFTAGTGR